MSKKHNAPVSSGSAPVANRIKSHTASVNVDKIEIARGFNFRANVPWDVVDSFVIAYTEGKPVPNMIVRPNPDKPGHYIVIDGHSRRIALAPVLNVLPAEIGYPKDFKDANYRNSEIEVTVWECTEREAYIANLTTSGGAVAQRPDLARRYHFLLDTYKMTGEELALEMGRPASARQDVLRLARFSRELEPSIFAAWAKGSGIKENDLETILSKTGKPGKPDHKAQLAAYDRAMRGQPIDPDLAAKNGVEGGKGDEEIKLRSKGGKKPSETADEEIKLRSKGEIVKLYRGIEDAKFGRAEKAYGEGVIWTLQWVLGLTDEAPAQFDETPDTVTIMVPDGKGGEKPVTMPRAQAEAIFAKFKGEKGEKGGKGAKK